MTLVLFVVVVSVVGAFALLGALCLAVWLVGSYQDRRYDRSQAAERLRNVGTEEGGR